MRNEELRKEIKAAGACIWEVAEHMGVSEMTIQRRLRKTLSPTETEAFRAAARAVVQAKAEREEARHDE